MCQIGVEEKHGKQVAAPGIAVVGKKGKPEPRGRGDDDIVPLFENITPCRASLCTAKVMTQSLPSLQTCRGHKQTSSGITSSDTLVT